MSHTIICTLPEELSRKNDPTGVLAALKSAEHPLAQFLTDDSRRPFDLEVTYQSEVFRQYADLPMEIVSFSAAGCLLRYYRFTEERNQEDPMANIQLHVNESGSIFLPSHQILSISQSFSNLYGHFAGMVVLGVNVDEDENNEYMDPDDPEIAAVNECVEKCFSAAEDNSEA